MLVFREAKRTSSQATPTECSWGHRVPIPSQQKVPGEPRDGIRVPVPFPSHSPLGSTPGKAGRTSHRAGRLRGHPDLTENGVGVLFILAALQLSPDSGESSAGAGCQPGKRHGARMPCPKGVVGMRLPHPFLPEARPPPLSQDYGPQLGKKGRGRPKWAVDSLLPDAVFPGLPRPTETLIAVFFPTFTVNRTR